jgi:hypothetical protein
MPTWAIHWTDAARPHHAAGLELVEADELRSTARWHLFERVEVVLLEPRWVVVRRVLRRDAAKVERTH